MPDPYVLYTIQEEDREQWDCFVSGHPDGHLLQSWEWGDLKASVGWRPLRFVFRDTQQKMVAGAQVLCRGAHLRFNDKLFPLPLATGHLAYIPKGPLIDWSQLSLSQEFFSQLHIHLRKQGALALQIEPISSAEVVEEQHILEHLASSGFHPAHSIQPLRTIVVDLTADEDTLLAHMKEKWRYNLRCAGRKGVTVREAQTQHDVIAWYTLLQTTCERDHFGIHTLQYYLQAWHLFASRHQGCLLLAEYDGHLLAGIFVGLLEKQAIYLYGASGNEYRNLMPNYLLQWEAMRWAKREGATSYDLWGIPETDSEEEAMVGIYRFKRGWGGEIVRFIGCYEHIYRPLQMHLAKKVLSLY